MKKASNKKRFSIVPEELMELAKGDESGLNNFIAQDDNEQKIVIRITAKDITKLLPHLETFNFEVVASSPENNFVEGAIPARRIPGLRTLKSEGILGVIPVYKPITNVGAITSQADFVHESDRVREALPDAYDGTGVTVGIMSDSYDNLGGASGDIESQDLPGDGVNVLQDLPSGGIDEGRAMAQLVHDLAPGADLAFSSVFISEADFAQQIRDLADPTKGDADVLVDDIIYFAEPFFQDGIIAQAVDDVVTNEGVTYFSSAGNSADKAFESDAINFVADPTLDAQIGYASPFTYYDFDTSTRVDTTQSITLNPNQRLLLSFQWDDPFYTVDGVDTDLDLFLFDSEGNYAASAELNNLGSQVPSEILFFANGNTTETYELAILKYSGPNPGRLKYVNFGDEPVSTEYPNEAPTIYGHSAAVNAQAVAAVPWFDQDNPEYFTSKGSTTILFESDGTPKASPEVRNTPDIAAIDGTNTTFFGSDIPHDSDGFANFFGTSAAAPHAAAIAALIKEANPNLTPEQIYAQLQRTAEDIHIPGHDDLTGIGLINAFDAVYGSVIPASIDFSDDFEDGYMGIMYETNSSGAGKIEVTTDYDPVDLSHLVLHTGADNATVDSLNEVTLHFDATNFANIQLSFDQKEYNDEDNPMSESFVDSENSDGVALSVDGTNWYSLISLTGTESTNTYQTHSFNLSDFAASKNLTLESDVQIKFQQFDNSSIDLDGMALDNISVSGEFVGNEAPTVFDDSLQGTSGDDEINGLRGNDTIDGLSGNDTLLGGNGNDILWGNEDLDILRGGNGNDSLYGGTENDTLFGGKHNDYLEGNDGSDTLQGAAGKDTILGGADDDRLFGSTSDDSLEGGGGNDTLQGGRGNDTLLGGMDNDIIRGYGDDDELSGVEGRDRLFGGSGDDTLIGGMGYDVFFGEAGQDTFILDTNLTTNDRDMIRDFELDIDVLGVSSIAEVDNLNVSNNVASTSSIITGANGQQVAILFGITDITIEDLDFVEI